MPVARVGAGAVFVVPVTLIARFRGAGLPVRPAWHPVRRDPIDAGRWWR